MRNAECGMRIVDCRRSLSEDEVLQVADCRLHVTVDALSEFEVQVFLPKPWRRQAVT